MFRVEGLGFRVEKWGSEGFMTKYYSCSLYPRDLARFRASTATLQVASVQTVARATTGSAWLLHAFFLLLGRCWV